MSFVKRQHDIEDDDDDDDIDPDDYPCYGKSWRLGDKECIRCELEKDCKRKYFTTSSEDEVEKRRSPSFRFIGEPVRKYDYPTNYDNKYDRQPVDIMVPMPADDENPWERLLKNILFGLFSRAGWEIWRFFDQVSRRW